MEKKNASIYRDLRNHIFALLPEKFGISSNSDNTVFGVVMDIGYAVGWATIIALADGSASLYLSNGGEITGGDSHDAVRKAAIAMTEVADTYQDQTKMTESTPLPSSGDVTFYLLTTEGIRAGTAKEDDLGEQRHALSPLFFAGQDVITQLRLLSEMKTETND